MTAEVMDGGAVGRWCRLSAETLAQARSAIDAPALLPTAGARVLGQQDGSRPALRVLPGAIRQAAEPGLARHLADQIGQARLPVEVGCCAGGPVPLLVGVE
jgi:hypothetical protein